MRLKLFFISLIMLITITMGYILNNLLRIYRIYVFISADSTPKDIERFHTITRYQNIIWILIAAIILGLIALICIENKKKILKFIKKF